MIQIQLFRKINININKTNEKKYLFYIETTKMFNSPEED